MRRPPSLPYQSAKDARKDSVTGGWLSFTPLEIAVVIGIVALLVVILLPLFDAPRYSPVIHCMSNLRQIGMATVLYERDFPGQVPQSLDEAIACYADTPQSGYEIVLCPSDPNVTPAGGPFVLGQNASYAYYAPVPQVLSPTTRSGGLPATDPATVVIAHCFPQHHGGDKAPVVFADGHAELVSPERLRQLLPDIFPPEEQ